MECCRCRRHRAVGNEMIKILKEREFPVADLALLASERSAGKILKYGDQEIKVKVLNDDSFQGMHIGLFSAVAASVSALLPCRPGRMRGD